MKAGQMPNWLRDTAANYNKGRSLAGRAREKRWKHLDETFPSLAEMRVLDLGGTPDAWVRAPVIPESVTVVNLERFDSVHPVIKAVEGDACNLPAEVASDRFDLVFSNSVLEHVGGHIQRQKFVDNVHALADCHWVQTPYRYFPIEPHWLFPGMQWLPYEARVQISLRWNRGHIRTFTREDAQDQVDEIELMSISQMHRYFPSSMLWYERFAGLIKSIVAIQA